MKSRLDDLEATRTEALSCLQSVADTLCSLSKRFQKKKKLPRNVWKDMDRPLPPDDDSLGSAFELWHAILRAEQALRSKRGGKAEELDKAQEGLLEVLTDLMSSADEDLVSRLTRDDIYGTLNPFSCAAVLRSEVFPQRSEATPSYLAGYVLCAHLQFARDRALSSSGEGVRDRTPRLAGVAQSVHSLMLYVEHLEARSENFIRIRDEIDLTTKRAASLNQYSTLPGSQDALDASIRKACVVIAQAAERCQWLMLSTKEFFAGIEKACIATSASPEKIASSEALWRLFSLASESIGRGTPVQTKQETAYSKALGLQTNLAECASDVYTSLNGLLVEAKSDDREDLGDLLQRLAEGAKKLLVQHLGQTGALGTIPSVGDSARFQFIVDVLDCVFEQPFLKWLKAGGGNLGEQSPPDKLVTKLQNLLERYGVAGKDDTDPITLLGKFGDAQIGKSILKWWELTSHAYRNWWLKQRHKSFETTKNFCAAISAAGPDPHKLQEAFQTAATEYKNSAEEIRSKLKDCVQWCHARGREILLRGETDSGPVDPNELISALWIADRLGEPWSDAHENAAAKVIHKLQRPDGGFNAVDPLYQNRGFLFYPSSAQTVSALARFVTRGRADLNDQKICDRLLRWEKVLSSGTRFLAKQMVREGKEAGWHSDRHREPDRIDCAETSEAVIALCRVVDAYTSLLYMEASAGFSVKWPNTGASKATPTDCGKRNGLLLLTVMGVVRDLRRRTWLYSPLWHKTAYPPKATRSLLFYGPPGTGKTFFQELIAGELKWPLVTITIGDFLANGEDKVVATTVEIFRKLNHLSHACIVFDEFDEMVVDRNKSTNRGHTGFDLLTPALLPLLAELRSHAEAHHCFVSFTTNYRERVDTAASRVGRVDRPELLNYCDPGARLLFWIGAKRGDRKLVDKSVEKLLLWCSLCGTGEVDSFMKACPDDPGEEDFPRPAVDPGFYADRISDPPVWNEGIVRSEAMDVMKSIGVGYTSDEKFCERIQHKEWLKLTTQNKPSA